MNKHTQKLLNFLDEDIKKNSIKMSSYDKKSIVQQISECIYDCMTDDKNELKLINDEMIKKIHEYNEDPLIWILYYNMCSKSRESLGIKNVTDFFNYYRMNHDTFDVKNMCNDEKDDKTYKIFYDVMFNPPKNRQELHKLLYNNLFVSLDVIQHAECENLNYNIYKNSNTEVHIYVPEGHISPDINIINKIICFFRKLTKKNKQVKLITFYGNQKKYLPTICDTFMCPDNVNSGVTMKGGSGSLIGIWRKEEFYKILIHELIHYFDIDFYVDDKIYEKISKYIKTVLSIYGDDKFNESYTEVLAVTIHSALYSYINNIDFNTIINNEIIYSYFQVAKILNFYGCKKYSDLSSIKIKQKTSVLSYYIIKCMFLANYEKILNYWELNGFSILNKSEEEFFEFYKDVVNFKSLDENIVNSMIEKLSQTDNKFVFKTMRMSMYQL